MALIWCPECSAQVSSNALACPSCGYPISKLTNLHDAVHANKASLVADLIKIGAEVEVRDKKGRTPLMVAAAKGNVEIVERLLQAGANPGYVNSMGETALTIAGKKRKKEIARLLRLALVEGVTSARKRNLQETPILPASEPQTAKDPEPVTHVQKEKETVIMEDVLEIQSEDFEFQELSDTTDTYPGNQVETEIPDKHREQEVHCLECNGSIAPEEIKCSHCGALIVRRYCSHCSKLIPEHASVCSFCGKDGEEHFRYSQHPEARWISGAIAVLFLLLLFVVIWHAPSQKRDIVRNAVPTNEPLSSERQVEEPAMETVPAPEPVRSEKDIPVSSEPVQNPADPTAAESARKASGPVAGVRSSKTKRTTPPAKISQPEKTVAKPAPKAEEPDPSVVQEWEASVADPLASSLTNEERESRGRKLNNQGYTLLKNGRVKEAIPLLEQSVRSFPANTKDPYYAYALFNLARALRITGRPDLAIPLLEQRIKINDQRDVVARELQAAKRQAGDASDNIQYQ